MNLDYDNAYLCHGSLTLHCVVKIVLKSLSQRTYEGLLEGVPDARLNDRLVQSAVESARTDTETQYPEPFLIPPLRRPWLRTPGDMDGPSLSWTPERLPMITCTARLHSTSPARDLRMDASTLPVVWFQDDYAMPIDSAVLEAIRAID